MYGARWSVGGVNYANVHRVEEVGKHLPGGKEDNASLTPKTSLPYFASTS
jgi:hypothetical protein